MEVVSLSPLRVAPLVWQPRRGSWGLTVVCKATYVLFPVEATLAHEQHYPNEEDNHWDDDAARSVYTPNDLVPFKPRADVVLVGNAFAPRGEPVRSLVARLATAGIDKSIEVHGDRAFARDGIARDGPLFTTMSLRYERAAGGGDSENPVGVRTDAAPDAHGLVPIPNLQPVGHKLRLGTPMEPVGFGPIASTWRQRRMLLGPLAGFWDERSLGHEPVPEQLDPRYFNVAPRDQQVDRLRDDEAILLENLHPDHPRLVTRLPGVRPRAFIERSGAAPQELTVAPDTLWIDTSRAIATLTWRGQLALDSATAPVRVTVALEAKEQRLSWADVERVRALSRDMRATMDVRGIDRGMDGRSATGESGVSDPGQEPPRAPAVPEPSGSARLKRPVPTTQVMTPVGPFPSAPRMPTTPGVGPSPESSNHGGTPNPASPAARPSPSANPARGSSVAPLASTIEAHVDGASDAALPVHGVEPRPSPAAGSVPAAAPTLDSAVPPPPPGGAPLAALMDPALNLPPDVVQGLRAMVAGSDPTMASPVIDSAQGSEPPSSGTRHSAGPTAPGVIPAALEELARGSRAPLTELRDVIELIWFDAPSVPALRDRFHILLTQPDAELAETDRRDVVRVLACAEPIGAEAIDTVFRDSIDELGSFSPPVVVLAGLLTFSFEGENGPERMLIERRRYPRKLLLGESHLRALITPVGSNEPIVVYLSEAAAPRLPMFTHFPVKMIAELHAQQDQYEACPVALRALALARVLRLSGG